MARAAHFLSFSAKTRRRRDVALCPAALHPRLQTSLSMDVRELIEATLRGRDERFVAKCDVAGILGVFESWDIYDVDTLSANLRSSFDKLQTDLQPVAARSFLGLLQATLTGSAPPPPPPPPETPSAAPPATPFVEPPPFFSPPLHPSPPSTVPIVVTIKMNGKMLAERTTLSVPPSTTWEAVARMRLEAVLHADEVEGYVSMPLSVSLFPANGRCSSRRVSARPAPRSRARSAQRSEPFARLCGSGS